MDDGTRSHLACIVGLVAACVNGGCGASQARGGQEEAPTPLDYGRDAHWICKPGMEGDPCMEADLTATELHPDGRTARVAHVREPDPAHDCFYVYPTVALGMTTGNDPAFADLRRVTDPLRQQAAWFSSQCRVFAPLYRQITVTTYVAVPPRDRDRFLERAYADVEAAFRHYLRHHGGDRPFVLLGHSQGAHMLRRLLERVVAPEGDLRRRLVVAVLPGGDVLATRGGSDGGNTGGIPLCTTPDQTECVIAYRAQAEEAPPPPGHAPTVPDGVPEGLEPACVHPAAPGGGRAAFGGSYFATSAHQRVYDPWQGKPPAVDTPFVLYRGLYEGECVRDGGGFPYLAVGRSPHAPEALGVPFEGDVYAPGLLGLHLVEYALALGDLMALVDHKASAWMAARPPSP
jgi:hypothetical protein